MDVQSSLLKFKRLFGLIGKTLTHSFSKSYFTRKFEREDISDAYYQLFPLENLQSFTDLFDHYPNLVGLNVTIPFKQSVIPYLDSLSTEAKSIGAVNTIHKKGSQLCGFNTDAIGFEKCLINRLQNHPVSSALVLGTGGAAASVRYVLEKLKINTVLVSRDSTKGISYESIDEDRLNKCQLIVNTTPLGMYPNLDDKPPLFYEGLSDEHLLFDLVYNPSKTLFLEEGIRRGCKVENGMAMLVYQAEEAWKIWNEIST